jgi:hypothetical protein
MWAAARAQPGGTTSVTPSPLACSQIARLICQNSNADGSGWITDECHSNTLKPLDTVFYVVDVIFLVLFLIEIILKLFGLGLIYLKDALNAVDCVIIVASIVMTVRGRPSPRRTPPGLLAARCRRQRRAASHP